MVEVLLVVELWDEEAKEKIFELNWPEGAIPNLADTTNKQLQDPAVMIAE